MKESDIQEYQTIYQRVYGQEISYQEAYEQAHALVTFIEYSCKL